MSLVPLPAAIMAMAMRGGLTRDDFGFAETADFDFFIRPNIQPECGARYSASKAEASIDGEDLASYEQRCGREEQHCGCNLVGTAVALHRRLLGHAAHKSRR